MTAGTQDRLQGRWIERNGFISAAAIAAACLSAVWAAPEASAQRAGPPKLIDGATASLASTEAPRSRPQPAVLFQPVMDAAPAVLSHAAPQTPAAEPSDAFGRALAAKLAGRRDAAIRESYAAAGFTPIWLTVDPATGAATGDAKARALIAAFALADAHALPLARYGGAQLTTRLNAGARNAAAAATLERDLSRAFALLANDIYGGMLEPRKLDRDMDVETPSADARAVLAAARRSADPAALLQQLAPQNLDYAQLMTRWRDLRLAARSAAAVAPVGPKTLRLGDAGPEVERLHGRLALLGDLPQAAPLSRDAATGAPMFDGRLEASVRAFQTRHGLTADGVVGANTYAALNTPIAARATQIAVNMEQMRWRNKPLGKKHVLVNLPDFHVNIVDDGRVIFRSRVIIGKARRHQSPEFSDEMEYMVVNPKWNVPSSIAGEKFLPQLKANPYALSSQNIRVFAPGGGEVDPASVNWNAYSRGNLPFRMRQDPGPGNALGNVKFMFPNRHAVYLHDTPTKSLFDRQVRAFSHGCIRVAKPTEMALTLLSKQSADPTRRYQTMRSRFGEQYEHFAQPLRVHIVYRTAWVDAAGRLQLRRDVYGRDAKVSAALVKAGLAL